MDGKGGVSVLRDVGRLFRSGTTMGLTDAELLNRFADRGDEAAFEALLSRHGPMVFGVCRQLLRDPNDAHDAFQATALVLVRQAGSVRVGDSLGPWLYGVAYRVASRSRAAKRRRRDRERDGNGLDPTASGSGGAEDLAPVLHEELSRLPEPLRAPIVLCHLEGLTHDQAAARLTCPVGTVRSRLSRGRALLRSRLERRGLDGSTLTAAAWPLAFTSRVPPGLTESALKAASGTVLAVSAPVAALTEGVLMSLLMTKLKTVAALAAAGFLTAATGAAVFAYQAPGAPRADFPASLPSADTPSSTPAALNGTPTVDDLEARLNRPMSVDIRDQTLGDAVTALRRMSGVNIVLDPRAMALANVTIQTPVSVSARNTTLKEVLNRILQPLKLVARAEDEVVLITAPPGWRTFAKPYYVGDLLVRNGPPGSPDGRAESLRAPDLQTVINLVTSTVSPGTWQVFDAGGRPVAGDPQAPGSITPFSLSVSLIVRHTAETHDKLAALLRGVRRLPAFQTARDAEPEVGKADPTATPVGNADAADAPGLRLSLKGPDKQLSGALATYELTLENPGDTPARNVDVTAIVPAVGRLFAVPAGARGEQYTRRLDWQRPKLEPGEKAVISFPVRTGKVGPFRVTVEARADGLPPATATISTDVTEPVRVALDVRANEQTVDVGGTTTYRIKVVNSTSEEVKRLAVMAKLSTNVEAVSTSGTVALAKFDTSGKTVVFPVIEQIGPNETVKLSVTVKASQPGEAVCQVGLALGDRLEQRVATATVLVGAERPKPPGDAEAP